MRNKISRSYKNNQFDLHIGNWIRGCRRSKDQTQSVLGKHLGVSFQQIQKYEKGKNCIPLFKFKQVCDYFDTKSNIVFEEIDQKINCLSNDDEQNKQTPQITEKGEENGKARNNFIR
jgi:transcriptional regulator with XRE-family HTH domain